ncbi:hypothetical protein [Legionella tunisiensis]|uniref:hypothetical protein n=1 Tax=Legionella tunisiensis TaxID=1034944 RepID=UPI0002DE47F9|nr:hypothetical protein [Legionella tunisiensis]
MPLLVETLQAFNAYIRADEKSPEALKEHMKSYDKELEQLRTNFYFMTINRDNAKVYEKYKISYIALISHKRNGRDI